MLFEEIKHNSRKAQPFDILSRQPEEGKTHPQPRQPEEGKVAFSSHSKVAEIITPIHDNVNLQKEELTMAQC
ncbi:hypothetical protein DAPPUDRAFT_237040 [Daphnia pulex]|uniref:Uncharacterized protein n=1 Tax=Daphnia pulex TaxID=6669 RepID=E9G2L8_DAPPU|nr:hypothetical protein DAPPUDRAFT_237040 [Daphnia pulex]|eukprot:EFX86293.1 hypothetical protein DAPPUDRAFT_237040 [Daphnia pulex]